MSVISWNLLGRNIVYEAGIDELYKAVNRIRELKESVV